MRLDHHTLGFHVGVGAQVQRGVGGQQHRLQQRFDVGALFGGDIDEHRVAAEFLGHQTIFGELPADLGRVGTLLVDLVDRHDNRHLGGLRVVDGLHRLRHDTVVGGHHQDRDVGGLGAAGAHRGKRLVAGGVDERDRPLDAVMLDRHLVGADVLGDAAGLGLADVGLADGVQQPGFPVVDVTHDGHDRRTHLQILFGALVLAVGQVEGLQQLTVFVLRADDLDVVVHFAAEQLERLVADRLGGGDHLPEVEQRLHQRGRVGVDLLGEIRQRRTAGQPDRLTVAVRQPNAADHRGLHRVVFLAFLPLALAAALGRATGTAERAGSAATLPGTPTGPGTAAKTPGGRGTDPTPAVRAAAADTTAGRDSRPATRSGPRHTRTGWAALPGGGPARSWRHAAR